MKRRPEILGSRPTSLSSTSRRPSPSVFRFLPAASSILFLPFIQKPPAAIPSFARAALFSIDATRRARKSHLPGDDPPTDRMDPITLENVLHPTDFTETDHGATVHALRLAHAARGRLTFLHVGPKGGEIDWNEFPKTRKILADWGIVPENASHEDVLKVGLSVRKSVRKGDDLVDEIGNEIRKAGADLVVLSTHQRQGLSRWLKKPLAEAIAREIRRPVLFVPRDIEGFVDEKSGQCRLRQILVPVATDPNPDAAVHTAAGIAQLFAPQPITLTLLHVGPEETRPEVETSPHPDANWTTTWVHREGAVVDTILAVAAETHADLVVMSTDGRDGWVDAVLGTTTEQVLRAAACPLLAVPA